MRVWEYWTKRRRGYSLHPHQRIVSESNRVVITPPCCSQCQKPINEIDLNILFAKPRLKKALEDVQRNNIMQSLIFQSLQKGRQNRGNKKYLPAGKLQRGKCSNCGGLQPVLKILQCNDFNVCESCLSKYPLWQVAIGSMRSNTMLGLLNSRGHAISKSAEKVWITFPCRWLCKPCLQLPR